MRQANYNAVDRCGFSCPSLGCDKMLNRRMFAACAPMSALCLLGTSNGARAEAGASTLREAARSRGFEIGAFATTGQMRRQVERCLARISPWRPTSRTIWNGRPIRDSTATPILQASPCGLIFALKLVFDPGRETSIRTKIILRPLIYARTELPRTNLNSKRRWSNELSRSVGSSRAETRSSR